VLELEDCFRCDMVRGKRYAMVSVLYLAMDLVVPIVTTDGEKAILLPVTVIDRLDCHSVGRCVGWKRTISGVSTTL